jgi:hypothetical protein
MTILTSYLCCVLTRLREEVKNDKCELVFADVPVPMNCDNFHLRISRVLPTMQLCHSYCFAKLFLPFVTFG